MPRSYVPPAEWQRRLDALMRRVLRAPDDFHPSVVAWATWRKRWLREREGGQNLYGVSPETAARPQFLRTAACLNAAGYDEVKDAQT
jgi:hypothetical protein